MNKSYVEQKVQTINEDEVIEIEEPAVQPQQPKPKKKGKFFSVARNFMARSDSKLNKYANSRDVFLVQSEGDARQLTTDDEMDSSSTLTTCNRFHTFVERQKKAV